MAQMQFDYRTFESVEFKVVKEDWQRYQLSDGSVLKARLILLNVARSTSQFNQLGEPHYVWNCLSPIPFALISYPDAFRAEPTTTPITQATIAQSIAENVDFDPVGKQDEWNVYNLIDGTVLRLRLNIPSIQRTKLHGPMGEPLYNMFSGHPDARLRVAPNLVKKGAPVTPSIGDTKAKLYT